MCSSLFAHRIHIVPLLAGVLGIAGGLCELLVLRTILLALSYFVACWHARPSRCQLMVAEDLGISREIIKTTLMDITTLFIINLLQICDFVPHFQRQVAFDRVNLLPGLLVELKLLIIEHIWIQELLELSDGSVVLLTLLAAKLPNQVRLVVVFSSELFTG